MNKKLKIAFIADSISKFNPQAETTSFIAYECLRRGFECYFLELKDLFATDHSVYARAKKVEIYFSHKKFTYKILSEKKLNLKKLDCIFLRKDPPVDQRYMDHLTMLELISSKPPILRQAQDVRIVKQTMGHGELVEPCYGPIFINSPTGIKKANEKLYPFYFKKISPPSMVSCSLPILLEFVKKHKTTIVKPLNQSGGKGISLIQWNNSNKEKILKKVTHNFTQYVLVQKFIPDAKKGDKRILLWKGKILGSFLRVPAKGDFRGNMHAGASWVKTKVNRHELKLIKRLTPQLIRDGLIFVGLDVIGPYITEINITSPMGIREINELEGKRVEKIIVDLLFSF